MAAHRRLHEAIAAQVSSGHAALQLGDSAHGPVCPPFDVPPGSTAAAMLALGPPDITSSSDNRGASMGPTAADVRLHPFHSGGGPPADLWEIDKHRAKLLGALQALAADTTEWPSLGAAFPSLSSAAFAGHHAAVEAIAGHALGLRPSPGETAAHDESPSAHGSGGSMAALPSVAPHNRARVAAASSHADRKAGSEALKALPAAVAHPRRHAIPPSQQRPSKLMGFDRVRPEGPWLPQAVASGELPLPPSPVYPTEHEASGWWESRAGRSDHASIDERQGLPASFPHASDGAALGGAGGGPHVAQSRSRMGHRGVMIAGADSEGLPGPENGLMLPGPCELDDLVDGLDPTYQGGLGGPGSNFGWG